MTQIDDNTPKESQTPPRAKESFAERFLAKKGKRWLFLYTLQVHVLVIFSIVVVYALQSYNTIQAAIFDVGINVDVVLIILILWGVWLTYAVALLIRAIRKMRKNVEIAPRKINKVLPAFMTFLFGVLYIGVNFINNSAITVFYRILAFVGLLLLAETAIALIILAGPIVLHVKRTLGHLKNGSVTGKARRKMSVGLVFILGVYLVVILVPYLVVPANVLPGVLPAKPQFIVHRMGGFIGPENTIEGADVMRQFDAIGMEIDIRVSWDGVPFLLHDNTLTRTTDIADKFPERKDRPADNFTYAELRSLDAGSKFLTEPNALFAQQYLNAATLESFRGAKIASLDEAIAFCETYGWILDANIKGLSDGHPNATNYEENILKTLNSSSIPKVFVGGHLDQAGPVVHVTDDYDGDLAALKLQGYDIVIVDDLRAPDAIIRQIPAAGLDLYMQFIDDPVTFSQVWCLGVTYIMTDTPYLFQGMTAPLWSMPTMTWYILCLAVQAILGLSIVFAIIRQKKR